MGYNRKHKPVLARRIPLASPIASQWLFTTVRIENQWGGTGTGFLVSSKVSGDLARVLLVTNKHIVHEDPSVRQSATHLTCHFNVRSDGETLMPFSASASMADPSGAPAYREHPDADTDVLAVDNTPVISQNPNIVRKFSTYEEFSDGAKRTSLDISVGEDIVVLGYPVGLRQGGNNLPLVRQGIIASEIGGTIVDEVRDATGQTRPRTLRGFLIDGGTVPGSSGSPVVLKPVPGRIVRESLHIGVPPAVLLGIVAETRYAPIPVAQSSIPSFAGLGLAFEVETIYETIELFFVGKHPFRLSPAALLSLPYT
jgi:hypothetical protein